MPPAPDWTYADTPASPYFRNTAADRADFNRRAEQVGERHMRLATPEFCSWLDGRITMMEIAHAFAALFVDDETGTYRAITRNVLAPHRDAWFDYCRENPRELRTEIAREP